jgi:hypothetical protein
MGTVIGRRDKRDILADEELVQSYNFLLGLQTLLER